MTKEQIQSVMSDVVTLLQSKGYKVTKRNGTYGDGFGALRITVADPGSFGEDGERFKRYAHYIGLESDDLGRVGKWPTLGRGKIVGLRERGRKRLVVEGVDGAYAGKQYVFDVEMGKAVMALARD